MDVTLRRAGRGPAPARGFEPGGEAGGQARQTPSAGGRGGGPTGPGGPPPRFSLTMNQYLSGRAAWRGHVQETAARRNEAKAERQNYRAELSEMTGGRLSTGRSHRGFHSAAAAHMRRQTSPGESTQSSESSPAYRPASRRSGSAPSSPRAAMDGYFAKRQARLASYEAMHGGMAPRRSRPERPSVFRPLPKTIAPQGPAEAGGPTIEEMPDEARADEASPAVSNLDQPD